VEISWNRKMSVSSPVSHGDGPDGDEAVGDGRQAERGGDAAAAELGLSRGERLLLAIGLNLACAVIRMADRPFAKNGLGWTRGHDLRSRPGSRSRARAPLRGLVQPYED
jgi:hypothetical protein